MTQWYVKELSKITNVSVQTLHHYDRIALLKPSIRLSNGYRVYSEKDLLKLQQIIALKYFGFRLSQIKNLLSGNVDVFDHFSIQSQFLQEKAKSLFDASENLKNILQTCNADKSIPWETIIKLIEVYRMTQQLEKSWVGKVLTPDELKEYAHFEHEIQTRFTESEKQASLQEWSRISHDVEANINNDPLSQIGIEIGKRCMTWVNNMYGKDRASLRNAIWEKGFMRGYGYDEHGLSKVGTEWLDKAIFAYHTDRIRAVVKQIENNPADKSVFNLWEKLLVDICGTDENIRKELITDIMKNEKISVKAKEWMKKASNFN